jgi:nucleotidyltransferase/DNA polymerase involved in DNA repair
MALLATFTSRVEMEALPPPVADGRRRAHSALGYGQGDGAWFANPGRLRREQGIELAYHLREAVQRETRLDPAIGLAANRFTARVAAASLDPHEVLLVARSGERDFLAPYPVTLLPIYPEQARQLGLLGIATLGDLARLPVSALGDLFGGQGAAFKRLAEGRDTTPVRAYVARRAERAAQPFDDPVDDHMILRNVIMALTADLTRRLEARGQMAGQLILAVTLAGGGSQLGELALRQPSASAEHISRTFGEMLDSLQLGEPVTGLEISLGEIVEAEARQLSLFPPESVPQDRLREVLHQLVARHGSEAFFWADLTAPDALLPERRFRLRQVDAA